MFSPKIILNLTILANFLLLIFSLQLLHLLLLHLKEVILFLLRLLLLQLHLLLLIHQRSVLRSLLRIQVSLVRFQLFLQIRELLSFCLSQLFNNFCFLFYLDEHDLRGLVETDRTSLHTVGFFEVASPRVVNADPIFFAAFYRVGLGELSTLLH